MKKIILIISLGMVISAGAVMTMESINGNPKLNIVSENINIPYFIDTFMLHERDSINTMLRDSNSVSVRLGNLGFSAKANNSLTLYSIKAISELYKVYDEIYPNHPFISYRCAYALMKKYKLSLGAVSDYIGVIPTREIDSMEKFKVSYLLCRNTWYVVNDLAYDMGELASMHNGYGIFNGYLWETYNRITNGEGHLGGERDMVKYSILDMKKRSGSTPFFILAPSSSFVGKSNDAGNYGNIDPVVLAPMECGYIIVASW